MTINNSKSVNVPVWLISTSLSLLTAAIISWGIISSVRANVERSTQDIEILRKEKVARDEFTLVLEKLNSIEKKLDEHIQKNSK